MIKRWKVALNLRKLTDTGTIAKAREIVIAMNGAGGAAGYFPTPDPPLADITTQANVTEQAYLASRNAGTDETAIFRNEMDELERLLVMEANYVEIQANKQPEIGDQIILSAAMDIKAEPTRDVQDFAVSNTQVKGEVKANMKAQGDRVVYLWDYKLKGDEEWTRAGESTQSSFTYTDLKSAKRYEFRGGYVLSSGDKIYFDPINLVVL